MQSAVLEAPEKPARKVKTNNGEIPVLARIKARNLYLHESLPYKAISEATGLPVRVLERLSNRERWPTIRRANYERLKTDADARMVGVNAQVVQTIVDGAGEHAIRALQKTGEALERTDRDAAKDAQAYSSTVKNLATIAKALSEPASSSGESTTLNLNMFFAPAQSAEAKQVTE